MDIQKRLKQWEDACETLQDDFIAEHGGRPGPTPKAKNLSRVVYIASGIDDDVEDVFKVAAAALGPRKRGAKQWGDAQLYVDLASYCLGLRKAAITMPRGGSLSKKAAMHGLGQLLRKHGYMTSETPDDALLDSEFRLKIGKRLATQFGRIADAIEGKNTPK